jgi:hypothetical protein
MINSFLLFSMIFLWREAMWMLAEQNEPPLYLVEWRNHEARSKTNEWRGPVDENYHQLSLCSPSLLKT